MANTGILEKLEWIQSSLAFFISELILAGGILVVLTLGIVVPAIRSGRRVRPILAAGMLIIIGAIIATIMDWGDRVAPVVLFSGMVRADNFAAWMKLLCDIAGVGTLLMAVQRGIIQKHVPEFTALVLAVLLGAHLLVMSTNMVMIFLSVELISISSYVLAGYTFQQRGAEGSLKYFLFGAAASAIMLYGFSLLYGLTGTADVAAPAFADHILRHQTPLLLTAGLLALSGFLFKMAAVPMHGWAPDIYEAAPMPVIAFFSVVPKLAGLGVLARFVIAINAFGQSSIDWRYIIGLIAIVTISAGNVAALRQRSAKRMMAYSSIAQSGFMLIGIVALTPQAVQFMLFYASVYMVANYLVFLYLQHFETKGIDTIPGFAGTGRSDPLQHAFLLAGLISLTGIPPLAGFTAKLLIFTGLYESYQTHSDPLLVWIFVLGLLNTVISLFYYVSIPFFAFFRHGTAQPSKYLTWNNLFGLILVLALLILFFQPNLLMGWINKITFVL